MNYPAPHPLRIFPPSLTKRGWSDCSRFGGHFPTEAVVILGGGTRIGAVDDHRLMIFRRSILF